MLLYLATFIPENEIKNIREVYKYKKSNSFLSL